MACFFGDEPTTSIHDFHRIQLKQSQEGFLVLVFIDIYVTPRTHKYTRIETSPQFAHPLSTQHVQVNTFALAMDCSHWHTASMRLHFLHCCCLVDSHDGALVTDFIDDNEPNISMRDFHNIPLKQTRTCVFVVVFIEAYLTPRMHN